MFKIFNKKNKTVNKDKKEADITIEEQTSRVEKPKKNLSELKEQKIKYREEKKKRQEQNKIKRQQEEKEQEEKLKLEEQKRQEQFKRDQEQKQEEFKKRQENKKVEKDTKKDTKEYKDEEQDFDLFGYKVIDLKQGMIIEGVVLSEGKDEYIVEVKDNFQEVIFPKNEKSEPIKIGQEVKALIYRHSNDDFYISQRRLANVEIINKIKEMQKNKEIVTGKVIDFQNSNYIIELENGYRGVVYQVNIDLNFVKNPKDLIDSTFDFVIKRVYPRGEYKFELTRIPLLKEAQEQKADLIKEDIIINIKEFTKNKAGIEFDYEGFRVFIPYKLLGYGFIDKDSDLSSFINKEAKIIESKRTKYGYNVVASVRALEKDPWEEFVSSHEVGNTITGNIVRKEDYGLFIDLGNNLKGLYHKNNFSTDVINNFVDLKIGDELSTKIEEINTEKKQINLSALD